MLPCISCASFQTLLKVSVPYNVINIINSFYLEICYKHLLGILSKCFIFVSWWEHVNYRNPIKYYSISMWCFCCKCSFIFEKVKYIRPLPNLHFSSEGERAGCIPGFHALTGMQCKVRKREINHSSLRAYFVVQMCGSFQLVCQTRGACFCALYQKMPLCELPASCSYERVELFLADLFLHF